VLTMDLERLERRIEERRFKVKDADQLKTLDDVFDSYTVRNTLELMRRGVVEEIHGPVAQGKEAKVIWAEAPGGVDIALKVFYTSTAQFIRGRYRYVMGDPRFTRGVLGNTRKLIEAWCSREFDNLRRAHGAGVRVPKPLYAHRNILVMEFVGPGKGVPAPLLKDSPPEDPVGAYLTLLRYIERAYVLGGVVHADLSEYNVLNNQGELVVIDWGSAVSIGHPNSTEFLVRDVARVTDFLLDEGPDPADVARLIVERRNRARRGYGEEDGWLVIGGKRIIDELGLA
jgi:RIO kinase 1